MGQPLPGVSAAVGVAGTLGTDLSYRKGSRAQRKAFILMLHSLLFALSPLPCRALQFPLFYKVRLTFRTAQLIENNHNREPI